MQTQSRTKEEHFLFSFAPEFFSIVKEMLKGSGMAVTDKDILASARIFIGQYGDEALPEAMKRIEDFEAKGDIEGRECWNKIAWAIQWMQTTQNLNGESCH